MQRLLTAAAVAALALTATPAAAAVTFISAGIYVAPFLEIATPIDPVQDVTYITDSDLAETAMLQDLSVGLGMAADLTVGGTLLGESALEYDLAMTFADAASGRFTIAADVSVTNYAEDVSNQAYLYHFASYSFSADQGSAITLDFTDYYGGIRLYSQTTGADVFQISGPPSGALSQSLSAGEYSLIFLAPSVDAVRLRTMGTAGIDRTSIVDFQVVETGVPEPTTWALMIGGFGLAGTALRRRRPGALLTTLQP
ncbi:MAG: PEPxxWA-CTERM sorting domain-containing protein [Phenylobacterium sp.]|nr:PEPxxWA-CTERM sorting domain-containing protein [Phenylobacterium sp.]